ncbi:alpha-amylase family glycosyl hydrolase [Prolixibacter sp. SD074]|jgi:glycosidase|uniref:alpha-amylase family glycosyl hydrolase n=1 Tax=Prolixibacter sp. SD074 TaxID=2652391 RepID=UPI00126DDBFA|nr:alpha-amylase family glycosyl hydrolase [Prolixibacter sp. SD074]GET30397.1 alpha-amylase [Prolixibacter sp. SD074]
MLRLRNLFVLALMAGVFFTACNGTSKKKTEKAATENAATGSVKSEAIFPDWSRDATIYEVNIRQYTKEGTFAAFEKSLPRLKKLGVNILWIMPINPISEKNRKGKLGSYYAVRDYKGVNPEFGNLADFKHLVDKAHEMGFHVLLDWVANHTGWDNKWITEHPDWYTQDSLGHIISPVPDWTDVADLNYNNPNMRAAMINAMKYWVKEANIDGYRCDVAGSVPVDFWNQARTELDAIKPVFMLAEDADNMDLLKKAFNANYGWPFLHIMNEIYKGDKTSADIVNYFEKTYAAYPKGSYPMIFTTNHDENSWNGTTYERLGDAVKTFSSLTFVVPGMPLIYSGQEAGLRKRLAFFEKDEIDWSDLSMSNFFHKLIQLKKDNNALWNGNSGGDFVTLENSAMPKVLTFSRQNNGNQVVSVFNLSPDPVSFEITGSFQEGTFKEAFTGQERTLNGIFKLDPWGYQIFVK